MSTAPRALAVASTSSETQGREGPPTAMRDVPRPAAPVRNNPARANRRLIIAGSVTAGLGLSLIGVAGYAGSQRIEARRASLELLAEAALSFLGYGTPPPIPSWGRMLQESQELLYSAPRLAFIPGAAIALAVLGFNLLGEGLRDRYDPRLEDRR